MLVPRRPHLVTGLALLCGAGFASAGIVAAQQGPPTPDFGRLYGRVEANGENLAPPEQRVIAFIDGQSCGSGTTLLAEEDHEDAGSTVYVVDVVADGTGPGQRPGCGTDGAPITLYFPDSGLIATQRPVFETGVQRANVDLGTVLGESMVVPFAAADGAP